MLAADLLLRPRLGPVLAPQTALIAAAATALLVLLPACVHGRPLAGLPRLMLGTALLAAAAQLLLGPPQALATTLAAAVMTALPVGAAGALVLLAPAPRRRAAHAFVLLGLATLALAPLWLAGALDALSRRPGSLDVLVAVNPLTALCAAAQTDYLRMDWFYRHSPLGSLRFDYPAPAALFAAYAGLVSGAVLLLALRGAAAKQPVPDIDAAPVDEHRMIGAGEPGLASAQRDPVGRLRRGRIIPSTTGGQR
jgi:hypothetical protein